MPIPLQEFLITDRSTRLASILEAWVFLDQFFPIDSLGLDWQRSLETALESAAQDPDGRTFGRTLQRMLADLKDGHVRLTGPGRSQTTDLTFGWRWLGDQLVVSNVPEGSALAPATVITHIDGRPTAEVMHILRGVKPSHPVVPTLEGIRAGRDEVLDRGLELLLKDAPGK